MTTAVQSTPLAIDTSSPAAQPASHEKHCSPVHPSSSDMEAATAGPKDDMHQGGVSEALARALQKASKIALKEPRIASKLPKPGFVSKIARPATKPRVSPRKPDAAAKQPTAAEIAALEQLLVKKDASMDGFAVPSLSVSISSIYKPKMISDAQDAPIPEKLAFKIKQAVQAEAKTSLPSPLRSPLKVSTLV